MPISQSNYRPPIYLFNGHLQTLAPVFGVKIDRSIYHTEKLELADGDFLELDWLRGNNEKLMILFHGLEGNSRSHYVQQMALSFRVRGWDILVMHARSCSREMNRLPLLYHGGATKDVETVVTTYAPNYSSVVLVGFSLGGSMALNYAGRHQLPANVKAIAGFSVPCHMRSSEQLIDKFVNRLYMQKFLKKLKNKVLKMAVKHPSAFDISVLEKVNTIQEFSEKFTAPFSGFKSLSEFYAAGSCLSSLRNIKLPTLLVNAQNDPFLSKRCFPIKIAQSSEYLFLDMPKHGGHSAFPISKTDSWMPDRLYKFLTEQEIQS